MSKNSQEFEQVFKYVDGNGDGKISPAELSHCVCLVGGDLLMEEAQLAIESLDSDGDGLLALEEFVGLMEVKEEEKVKDLRVAFEMYDVDKCGFITPKNLQRMLTRLGQSKTVDECAAMISHFDLNGDGVLSFDEFKVMML